MKKFKLFAICFLLAATLVLLSGCSALIQAFENDLIRGYSEVVLDSIIAEDIDGAYAIFSDLCTKDDFAPSFYNMKNLMKNVESYELTLLSINQYTDMSSGTAVTEISSVYEMTTNDGRYIVDVKSNSLCAKLSSFYIAPYEETDYYYTGTVTNMKDATVFQWVMLLSNLLIIGLMLFALIDCIRHKLKLKPLWIVVIILGLFTVGATVSQGNINLNLNLGWLTAYTAFIRYGGGTVTIRFMIPLGGAVYFILRHWMIKRPAPEAAPVTEYAYMQVPPMYYAQMPEAKPPKAPDLPDNSDNVEV